MIRLLRFIPIALKYMINVGPLLYQAVKIGARVVKVIRPKAPVKPEPRKQPSPEKIDPG